VITEQKNIGIKNASSEDLDSIFNNEQLSYEIPWSKNSLEACFKDEYSVFVMEYQKDIIGHMIIQWVLDEAHLHNVCVVPKFQSRGLGKLWMSHLVESAQSKSCSVIFLEVRESNLKAIDLYLKLGFSQIGERKNYYQTKLGREAGLVMELRT
jgi:ribosomal-protein-alanine N-acetyltransferase